MQLTNISLLYPQIKDSRITTRQLKRQFFILLPLKSSHNYVALHETTYKTIPMHLPFAPGVPQTNRSKKARDQRQAVVEMQSVNQITGPQFPRNSYACYCHSCVPSTKFYRIFVFFKHLLIYLSLNLYLSHSYYIYLHDSVFLSIPLVHKHGLPAQLCAVRTGEKRKSLQSMINCSGQTREQLFQA